MMFELHGVSVLFGGVNFKAFLKFDTVFLEWTAILEMEIAILKYSSKYEAAPVHVVIILPLLF